MKRPASAGPVEGETACVPNDIPMITIQVHGQGRGNLVATITVPQGIAANVLHLRVAGMLGQQASEIRLVNLDNPMYLVGRMRLNRDTRVAVQPVIRGG